MVKNFATCARWPSGTLRANTLLYERKRSSRSRWARYLTHQDFRMKKAVTPILALHLKIPSLHLLLWFHAKWNLSRFFSRAKVGARNCYLNWHLRNELSMLMWQVWCFHFINVVFAWLQLKLRCGNSRLVDTLGYKNVQANGRLSRCERQQTRSRTVTSEHFWKNIANLKAVSFRH